MTGVLSILVDYWMMYTEKEPYWYRSTGTSARELF
jgi:hypothetical protein